MEIRMNVNDLARKITEGVSARIATKEVALHFVLEELDAARQGNDVAIQFVNNSGFSASEYEGAMQNSFEEVDGANGPQQFLLSSVIAYSSDMDFMVNLRLQVIKNIIDEWSLSNQDEGRVKNLMQSLKKILEDDEAVMPELTTNIAVPDKAKPRHIYFREKNITSAKNILSTIVKMTGDDADTIINNSLGNSNVQEGDGTVITPVFEPVPELQSEEGVRIYLSKLSELSHSDLCSELSNVMAAKHNLMLVPSGLNDYDKKQEIVTDLTDKATAICIFEFGQSVIFGYADGDLRPFNELLNNIDEDVAQQNLSPDQHGSMILHRLKERLLPESNEDDDTWLEGWLSEESEGIDHGDYELIKEGPFIIFILMALADGEIDLKETTALAEVILNPSEFKNDFLVQVIRDAIPEITPTSIPECLAPIMNNSPDYLNKLQELKRAIDENLDASEALQFKMALIKLGYKIADASGGLFGLGSRVCKQEKKMLQTIAAVLGVTGV